VDAAGAVVAADAAVAAGASVAAAPPHAESSMADNTTSDTICKAIFFEYMFLSLWNRWNGFVYQRYDMLLLLTLLC
jgi:hypothetical protein